MKKTKNFLFVFLLILISVIQYNTSGLKIQLDDDWQYEDNLKQRYNETVLENIQVISNNDIISVMKVNTTRGFSFPYQKTINLSVGVGGQIVFDLSLDNIGLFVTQEGGITLYASGDIIGSVSASIQAKTKSFNITTGNVTFSMLGGDPSLALISTTSTIFSIQTNIVKFVDFLGNPTPTISYDVHYRQDVLVSTNNDPSDTIKNYTLTPILVNYEFNWKDLVGFDEIFNVRYTETLTEITQEIETLSSHWIETTPKKLKLLQNEIEPAQQYTYEEGIAFPTYIRQTEAVKVSGLTLSQIEEEQMVEYFLVREETTSDVVSTTPSDSTTSTVTITSVSSSTSKESFFVLGMFILIPIIFIIRGRK